MASNDTWGQHLTGHEPRLVGQKVHHGLIDIRGACDWPAVQRLFRRHVAHDRRVASSALREGRVDQRRGQGIEANIAVCVVSCGCLGETNGRGFCGGLGQRVAAGVGNGNEFIDYLCAMATNILCRGNPMVDSTAAFSCHQGEGEDHDSRSEEEVGELLVSVKAGLGQ